MVQAPRSSRRWCRTTTKAILPVSWDAATPAGPLPWVRYAPSQTMPYQPSPCHTTPCPNCTCALNLVRLPPVRRPAPGVRRRRAFFLHRHNRCQILVKPTSIICITDGAASSHPRKRTMVKAMSCRSARPRPSWARLTHSARGAAHMPHHISSAQLSSAQMHLDTHYLECGSDCSVLCMPHVKQNYHEIDPGPGIRALGNSRTPAHYNDTVGTGLSKPNLGQNECERLLLPFWNAAPHLSLR